MKITEMNVEQILFNYHVYDAINELRKYHFNYPSSPNKPVLKSNSTSTEIREYADLMEEYETKLDEYKLENAEVKLKNNKIDNLIFDVIKAAAGLYSIPEQYREKVWSKAWEDGHSDGYMEVYYKLESLIDIFQ